MFYYSNDLEIYIKEVSKEKEFFLLINKSDYLPVEMREEWSSYFKGRKINHIFFSALIEQDKIQAELREQQPQKRENLSDLI